MSEQSMDAVRDDSDQPQDAADEGAPGGSESSAQTAGAGETSQAEGDVGSGEG